MKRHEAMSVGDIIKEALQATGNGDEYYRQQICYLWSEVVGPAINRCTMRRYIDGDTMHVYLSSAVLKNELAFQSQALVNALNQMAGKEVISRIAFH